MVPYFLFWTRNKQTTKQQPENGINNKLILHNNTGMQSGNTQAHEIGRSKINRNFHTRSVHMKCYSRDLFIPLSPRSDQHQFSPNNISI